MGLKPDHWIRKMAREHGMIEPFADSQVRNGVISYGVSSYGYDIRVADEFKIFTNVYSAIVDPKQFDPRSMVDYTGEVCVIPPNSFALARTIEYFRIPRSVLTVCLGKCLTGDTRVVNAKTGEYLTLEEFISSRASATVSLDGWSLKTGQVTDHIDNGLQPVYQLTTYTGLKIKATANHPFRTLEGWMPLCELRKGDRIAVARNCPVFGERDWPEHEAVLLGLMLSDGQCHTPGHSPRFTTADPAVADLFSRSAQLFGCEVSRVARYGYNLVNHQGRGGVPEKNRAAAWLESLGCNVRSPEKQVPSVVFTAKREAVRKFLQALFTGDGSVYTSDKKMGVFLEYSSSSEKLIRAVHHLLLRFNVFGLIRSKRSSSGRMAYRVQITDLGMILKFAREIGFLPQSKKQNRLEEIVNLLQARPARRSNFDTLPAAAWSMLRQASLQSSLSLRSVGIIGTQPDQSLPYNTARHAAEALANPSLEALVQADVIWDRVRSIEPAGVERVYDLTVPGMDCFLANDMIVHNSTYARCFRGDTRVALVDGTAPTLEQMARRAEDGELFWGYSIGQFGRIIVSLLEAPRLIGKDALIEIALDNQAVIHCTPDHEFVLRDGRMIQANELRPGDSLMPLYRKLARGYEMVYQPSNRHLYPTHRLADEWNLRNGIYPDQPNTHRHHKDHDRLNNMPWNIERMEMNAHIKLHNQESYGEEFDPDEHSQAIREAFQRLSLDPDWRAHFSEVQRERALQFWNDEQYALAREQLIQRESHNHRITGIRELPGDHDVYCLTVPEAGNFALEAGVFVSNCGIIVNVTPFEPEWEGFVTLEISNTTPLPAKIYANEGIAQVLFFEADEQCETSYADKKGKYQSQQSIVLPKL